MQFITPAWHNHHQPRLKKCSTAILYSITLTQSALPYCNFPQQYFFSLSDDNFVCYYSFRKYYHCVPGFLLTKVAASEVIEIIALQATEGYTQSHFVNPKKYDSFFRKFLPAPEAARSCVASRCDFYFFLPW